MTTDYDVKMVGWGLLSNVICYKNEVGIREAARLFELQTPAGTRNGWHEITPQDFYLGDYTSITNQWVAPDGEPYLYPLPCVDNPETHSHALVVC